jgi:DNA polymerase-3 subunit epsilon
VVASTVHVSSRNDYGPRPSPLAPRSTEGERETHAAFIRDVVKNQDLWAKFGL